MKNEWLKGGRVGLDMKEQMVSMDSSLPVRLTTRDPLERLRPASKTNNTGED